MKPSGESRLRASLQRLGPKSHRRGQDLNPKFCLDPSNAFEVAIAEQIRALRNDVDELKNRLNWLFGLIIAAALANVILAFLA